MTDRVLGQADARLRSWLTGVAGDVAVRADRPTAQSTGESISAFLLGFEPTRAVVAEVHRPAPVVVRLRYLVWADAPEPQRAVDLLDSVVAAAFESPVLDDGHRVTVDLDPIPAEMWIALGAPMRPAVSLRVDARHVRVTEDVQLVRRPLSITGTTIRSLTGRLVGPDEVPLVSAQVTLAATGASDRTSPSGAFTFAAVPAGTGQVRLAVRAKGRHFTADVDPDDDDIVVRCDPQEG